jgi:hypothetical protein
MTEHLNSNNDVIEELARRTNVPVQVVRDLYEAEVTKLTADATVNNFIGVIAGQRVKRRLRGRRRTTPHSQA